MMTGLKPTITLCICWKLSLKKKRFKGTCYKAANWILTGQTKGTAKKGHIHLNHGNINDVYLYPLGKDFRKKLTG